MSCPHCDKAASGAITGLYDVNCHGCGTRHMWMIPCKLQRVSIAKVYIKSKEKVDPKTNGHCDCARTCKRMAAARLAKISAQQAKKALTMF